MSYTQRFSHYLSVETHSVFMPFIVCVCVCVCVCVITLDLLWIQIKAIAVMLVPSK